MSGVVWGFRVERKGESAKLFSQVHGNRVLELSGPPAEIEEADGAWTRTPGFELRAYSADCIPVIFYSDGPVGVVHSGWRGTMKRIVPEMLARLRPWHSSLHVAVGPCLQGCCFEVKQDFVDAFRAADNPIDAYLEKRGGSTYCHLSRFLIETQLGEIPRERLHLEHLRCTYCSEPTLPSFRRQKSTDPQIKAFVMKRPVV